MKMKNILILTTFTFIQATMHSCKLDLNANKFDDNNQAKLAIEEIINEMQQNGIKINIPGEIKNNILSNLKINPIDLDLEECYIYGSNCTIKEDLIIIDCSCKKPICKNCVTKWAKTVKYVSKSGIKVTCPNCKANIDKNFTTGSAIYTLLTSFVAYAKKTNKLSSLTTETLKIATPFLSLYVNTGANHNAYYEILLNLGHNKLKLLHNDMNLSIDTNLSWLDSEYLKKCRLFYSLSTLSMEQLELLISKCSDGEWYSLDEKFVSKFSTIPYDLMLKIFEVLPQNLDEETQNFFKNFSFFDTLKKSKKCNKCLESKQCTKCKKADECRPFFEDNILDLYKLNTSFIQTELIPKLSKILWIEKEELLNIIREKSHFNFENSDNTNAYILHIINQLLSNFNKTDSKYNITKQFEKNIIGNIYYLFKKDTAFLKHFYNCILKELKGHPLKNGGKMSTKCKNENVNTILELDREKLIDFIKDFTNNSTENLPNKYDFANSGTKKTKLNP